MENPNVYPLKYAELTIQSKEGKILEAGCGAGRILRYYKDRGYDITGFDFIEGTVEKLKKIDPDLKVEVGDVTDLKYADKSFRYVLAFGLYHNLEHDLGRALQETYRVLETGGKVCASFRADNIQTRLTDWLAACRGRRESKTNIKRFHKMGLTKTEFVNMVERAGFHIESVCAVENMPILYKLRFFRAKHHRIFDETLARKEGYRLSPSGSMFQGFLIKYLPEQICNLFVVIAKRPI